MEQAGPLARGNTLYLNLEPCSHTGRTGPCADAIIAAGIARVVCCMEDPNPLVAGKGFDKLRAAGIEVDGGSPRSRSPAPQRKLCAIHPHRPALCHPQGRHVAGRQDRRPARAHPAGRPSLCRPGLVQLHHRRVCAPPRAPDAPRLRCHSGRRRHGHRRRSPAHRPQRTAAPPPSACASFSTRACVSRSPRAWSKPPTTISSSSVPLPRRTSAAPWNPAACSVCQVDIESKRPPPSPLRTRDVPISIAFSPGSAPSRSPACWWRAEPPSTGRACAPAWWTSSCSSTPRASLARWALYPGWRDKTRCPPALPSRAANIKIERFDEDFAVEAYLRDPYQPLGPQL